MMGTAQLRLVAIATLAEFGGMLPIDKTSRNYVTAILRRAGRTAPLREPTVDEIPAGVHSHVPYAEDYRKARLVQLQEPQSAVSQSLPILRRA